MHFRFFKASLYQLLWCSLFAYQDFFKRRHYIHWNSMEIIWLLKKENVCIHKMFQEAGEWPIHLSCTFNSLCFSFWRRRRWSVEETALLYFLFTEDHNCSFCLEYRRVFSLAALETLTASRWEYSSCVLRSLMNNHLFQLWILGFVFADH